MPAAAVSGCWEPGVWADTVWEDGVWAETQIIDDLLSDPDLNNRILIYLRVFFSDATGEFMPLLLQYLDEEEIAGGLTPTFKRLILDATEATTE